MRSFRMAIVVTATLLCLAAQVQAQMGPRKPEPELKKLAYFEGSWNLDGDMKASPMGPAGKIAMTEQCKWLDGGFFLTCNSDFKSAMGNGTGVSFMGWDSNGKQYTYDEFNSNGEAVHSPGTLSGDTWVFTSEQKVFSQTVKGRFTMKVTSPNSYDFKYEMSSDGTNWTTVMDGKAKKS